MTENSGPAPEDSEEGLRVTAVKLDPVRRAAVKQLADGAGLTVSQLFRVWIDQNAMEQGLAVTVNGETQTAYQPVMMRRYGRSKTPVAMTGTAQAA